MLVTGEQFEIRFGPARAVVTEVGAALRVFEVGGVPYVETYAADQLPPLGCGAVLVPWPNRVRDGRWVLDGEPQQLALTEAERGNAIHGLTQYATWSPVERDENAVTLQTRVNVQPGWPVPLVVRVRYAVGAEALTVTHTVENVGSRRIPFGVGAHPYVRAGVADPRECTLTLSATTWLPTDDRLLPAGESQPVAGTGYDLRDGRRLDELTLDTAFGGCAPDEGDTLVRHALVGPDGDGVEVFAEPVFRWVQVFTPDSFPGRGHAVAIEPMTCPPDALNSGVDLLWLEPGESWSAFWGLRPLRAA